MADKRKRVKTEYFFDYSLLFIVLFLLGFGLIMIYSVSSYEAYQDYGNASYYLKKQLFSNFLGLIAMAFVALVPYTWWRKVATFSYFGSLALVVMVHFFGVESHGAKRWLPIYKGFNLQPAEIAKIGIILFLAHMICNIGRNIKSWKGVIFMLCLSLPHAISIWLITDNMSSAIIVVGIAFLMVFVASPGYRKFLIMILLGAAFVAGAVYFIATASPETLGFRGERILAWLNPEAYAQDEGFQTLQALYAIGSGGIWGKGLGQSMQKLGFLPEAQNDMIFSIICEELGLFGAVAVISMFIMLLWRMMVIANNAPDLFGGLLVVGVMGHIAIQVIMNIAVVTNTMPNTGISLPFISYGGSSALFLLGEIGLVLGVAKRIQLKELN